MSFKALKEAGQDERGRKTPKYTINLTIQVASLYEGEGSAVAGTSTADLQELRDEHKVKIEAWDILGAMKKKLGRDVDDSDIGAETKRKLAQKAQIVNEELENFGAIRIGH